MLKAPQSVSHRRRLKLHSEGGVRQGADLLAYFIEGVLRIEADAQDTARDVTASACTALGTQLLS